MKARDRAVAPGRSNKLWRSGAPPDSSHTSEHDRFNARPGFGLMSTDPPPPSPGPQRKPREESSCCISRVPNAGTGAVSVSAERSRSSVSRSVQHSICGCAGPMRHTHPPFPQHYERNRVQITSHRTSPSRFGSVG